MKKYLVTGGSGFIGLNLVKKLLERREKVLAIDNFISPNIKEFCKNPFFKFLKVDITAKSEIEKAIKGVDYIFHQAAVSNVANSFSSPEKTFEINIIGTFNILQAAKKYRIKKVIFASSVLVYGPSPDLLNEDVCPNPISPYALSKYAGERLCQIFSSNYNLPTVCLRYFNVYGPGQSFNSGAVIPFLVNTFLKNKRPKIFGNGKQIRDFVFVEDVVRANLKAIASKFRRGEIFNVASGEPTSILEVINILNRILSKNIKPIFVKAKPDDAEISQANIKKIKKCLLWQPEIDLKKGLQKTIDWFKRNGNI